MVRLPRSDRTKSILAFAVVIFATVVFRIPLLFNASSINSDSAVVALQARHLLLGEFAQYLWGTDYQSSLDATLMALGFAIFGATPLVAMLVPLVGYVLVLWLGFDVLRRHVGPNLSAGCMSILVFAPGAVSNIGLYAPRQWSVTAVFLAVWCVERASARARTWLYFVCGSLSLVVAVYLDLFALQFIPAIGVLALACCFHGQPRIGVVARRLLASLFGLGLGVAGFLLVRGRNGANSGTTNITFDRISFNWQLMKDTCLPMLLGSKIYISGNHLYPDLWTPSAPIQFWLSLGGAILMGAVLLAWVWFVLPGTPWALRRIGLCGFVAAAASIVGFLLSPMPIDMWANRYLAPVLWFAPFAVAPLVHRLRDWAPLVLVPYVSAAAFAGWLSYSPYVNGIRVVRTNRGNARSEQKLARWLKARGVDYAAAPYWLCYRMTFLFHEDPIVVPIDGGDRYRPYRLGFDAASRVAYIFHASEPRTDPKSWERTLREQFPGLVRERVAGYTVLLVERTKR